MTILSYYLTRLTNNTAVFRNCIRGIGLSTLLFGTFLLIVTRGRFDVEGWIMFPVVFLILGGADGGLFFSYLEPLREQGGWKKVLSNTIAALVFIVVLYSCLIISLKIAGQWD
ncbi:MAG: hypothetical protein EOO88_61260 [Pedobacter sp.]|nr:MAG: hypothetical protein EOO88_61260 [Pedobacter sp.]